MGGKNFDGDQFEKPGSGISHVFKMQFQPEYRAKQEILARRALDLDHAKQEREIELLEKQERQHQFDAKLNGWNKLSDEQKEAYDAFSLYVSSTGKGIYWKS